MLVTFFDRQNAHNSHNGSKTAAQSSILSWLDETKGRPPFFCELVGDNGFSLLVGVGTSIGCAQYGLTSGEPPYLMAVNDDEANMGGNEYMDFLTADTDTPVPKKFCLPMARVREVLMEFVATGEKSRCVNWEEI